MMALEKQIAALNNVGVSYLVQRDFPNAIEALKGALGIVKQNCQILSATETQSRCADCRTEDDGSFRKRVRRSPKTYLSSLEADVSSTETFEDDWSVGVHTTGIRIEGDFCEDDYENAKCASATVIFNLASVFHIKSLSQSGCQKEMQKAKTLYLHVYGLISGVISTLNDSKKKAVATGNPVVDFLYLAVANNMAHANLDVFGDQETSSALFHKLVFFALSVREEAFGQGTLAQSVNMQLDIFLQNAVCARVSSQVTAPAA
jgi:hypothetical protein